MSHCHEVEADPPSAFSTTSTGVCLPSIPTNIYRKRMFNWLSEMEEQRRNGMYFKEYVNEAKV